MDRIKFFNASPQHFENFFFFFYTSLIYVTIVGYVDELPFSQSLEKIFRFSVPKKLITMPF